MKPGLKVVAQRPKTRWKDGYRQEGDFFTLATQFAVASSRVTGRLVHFVKGKKRVLPVKLVAGVLYNLVCWVGLKLSLI